MHPQFHRLLAWIGAAALLFAPPLSAADPKPDANKERAKLPAQLEEPFGMAMAAPPEFAAAALLRISRGTPDRDLRRELIDLAFHSAAGGKHPYRLEGLPASEPDTLSNSTASALRLGLDVLTLQSRAVMEMLAVDPARAKQLFGEMSRPALPAGSCDAGLLPEVSRYYEAFGAVAKAGFTTEERAKSEHISFVIAGLGRVSSVREIAPAIDLLTALDWQPNQFDIALGTVAMRLENAPPDARSFMASVKQIDEAVAGLIARARTLRRNVEPLALAYRKFLVTNFKAPRCADSQPPAGRLVDGAQNVELFGPEIRGELPALTPEETRAEGTQGEAKGERFWQTDAAQRVYQEALKLRQAPNGANLTPAARNSKEWGRQLLDVLSVLAGWKVGDESSEAMYFHQKSLVYEALLELAPAGENMERLVASFIGFLKGSNLQQTDAVEWFWHARSTLDRVRADRPDQAAKLSAAFRASGNVILVLEAMLDEAAPERQALSSR